MGSEIADAVILMAGSGSRLRASGENLPKPLIQICDRPLISYLIEALEKAGVTKLHIVVGPHGRHLPAQIEPLLPPSMRLNEIPNPDSHKQNGLSVLCAAGHVAEPFLLLMGDHLFEFALLERLIAGAGRGFLNLAIDRKIEKIFDLDDAMKVQTRGELVFAIAKDLARYDAIDTGLFICPGDFFEYLRRARRDDDCSLADGVRLMAGDQRVRAVDIGPAWWQDVDTQAMRARAEEEVSRLLLRSRAPSIR
jgi:choline kinase